MEGARRAEEGVEYLLSIPLVGAALELVGFGFGFGLGVGAAACSGVELVAGGCCDTDTE
jgi:hypothetical protein